MNVIREPAGRNSAAIVILLLALPAFAQDFAALRADLVDEVRQFARYAGDEPIRDDVLQSLNTVERHRFVPGDEINHAYENRPLSIGYGQTISQPYIVALMTDLLDPKPDDVVLEIGSGSGYQAAVLSRLFELVYSVERIRSLSERARKTLRQLDIHNVHFKIFDGTYGWNEFAPFRSIVVTAASPGLPSPLVDQLDEGGHLVVPIAQEDASDQILTRFTKRDGELVREEHGSCRFVPLVGRYGWSTP